MCEATVGISQEEQPPGLGEQAVLYSGQEDGQGLWNWEDAMLCHDQVLDSSPVLNPTTATPSLSAIEEKKRSKLFGFQASNQFNLPSTAFCITYLTNSCKTELVSVWCQSNKWKYISAVTFSRLMLFILK